MNRFLCILLLPTFMICGCKRQEATTPVPTGRAVRIALIAPMSGPDEHLGQNAILGIRTALAMQPYLNNGDTIELVVEDSKGSAEQIGSALAKLSNEEIAGVLLLARSDAVLSIRPIVDEYKIPILSLIATHPDITRNNGFISQLGFNDILQGTVAALYVRDEMLIDRVAVISDPGNTHYSFLADEFIRKFTSTDGKVLEHIKKGSTPGDVPQTLARLRDNNVQLIYLAVTPERVVRIAEALETIGWHPQLMGTDGLLTAIILQHPENLSLVDGIMATDFYSTIRPKTAYGKKAARIFNKLFTEPGTTYTALGCEGTSILLNAMDRCEEKTDRTCVNHMLRATRAFEGLLGKIAIREDGTSERPIFVNVIDDRKMEFLVRVY